MATVNKTDLATRAFDFYLDILWNCADDMVNAGIPVRCDKIVDFGIYPIDWTRAFCQEQKNETTGETEFGIYIDYNAIFHMNDTRVVANIKDVICHELLHTCNGCMTHNKNFLRYARLCDKMLGTHTLRHLDKTAYYNPDRTIKSRFVCEKCGFEHVLSYDCNGDCECEICGHRMTRVAGV